jgi:hypothetical protein
MSEYSIMKSQKDSVFGLIQRHGMSPEEFEWAEVDSMVLPSAGVRVSRIAHKPSGYFFQFDRGVTNSFYCYFSPGSNSQVEGSPAMSWDDQIQLVDFWLRYLAREIESPDFWTTIASEKALSKASNNQTENTAFSAEEVHKIHESLDEIKKSLISLQSFSPEQRQYLDNNFDYLKNAAKRMGRKDWMILFVGQLFNTALMLALNPSIAQNLFRIAGTIFKWLTGNPLLP